MSYLNDITITKEIEVDLIDLAYNHVDTLDELKELLAGISTGIVDAYQEECTEKAKEQLINDIHDVDDLSSFVEGIATPIIDEYHQTVIDESALPNPADIIDVLCSSNQDELLDVLICILNQHPKALHQFLASKQATVKLAMIESAQAVIKDLEDYF